MLDLARRGRSALLVAATGAGKTLAGFLPTICELAEQPSEGLHTLYVSPVKALAVDFQRNLIGPVEEMGLDIRVETRTGDTPSDRKARQRAKPPQVLLTTPESLSLLLSYPDAAMMFENLRTIVVDELHGFAKEKRGDLLSLSLSRLETLAPGLRRVGLSATISDPDAYRSWFAPNADMERIDLVIGDPGAGPDLSILIPENKIPWGGHSGYHAIADVMRLIEQHQTTLVFCNTRGLAELIFQKLWDENDQGLPIGIHHGSLAVEARRKVEAAMATGRLRGLVATASLDPEAGGTWRIARPQIAQQHRLNAGVIVEQPLLTVRFRNGRKLGTIEEGYASTLSPGDHFYFSGLSLEVEQFKDTDIIVRASSKRARIVTYGGQRMSMSTHLANRVRHMLCDRNDSARFPDDVREWLEVQSERSVLPEPNQLLVETFPHEGQHFMVAYSFEGWNAHQSLGMLITRRMESAGLKPMGFVANDYALACYGLEPITDPKALFSADILEQEFVDWVESSYLLKTAFREVAVIGGLVERQHPGKKKTGRQVSFSTDLIYDVLRRYEPQHLLLRAAWDDARRRMTELGRLVRLVDRASATMLHVETGRITPMAVPLMVIVGREAMPPGMEADETLLMQAEALAEEAMQL